MSQSSTRFCKRCLVEEISAEHYKHIQSYIAKIDDELKVTDITYQKRLDTCKECKHLHEGLCRACGCYVELRAVMKRNRCPYSKWLAVSDQDEADLALSA